MPLMYIFFASTMTALANFFTRRSTEAVKSYAGDPFLIQRLLTSGLFLALINYFLHGDLRFSLPMFAMGIFGGAILGCLMWTAGQSVDQGPPAATFAIINSAGIAPPLIMAFIFGAEYGHEYRWQHGFGAILVLIGIGWMIFYQRDQFKSFKRWVKWALTACFIHVIFLSFFHWRALLTFDNLPAHPLLPFQLSLNDSDCFTLAMFLTAAGFQLFLYQKPPSLTSGNFTFKDLLIWGILGGIINGCASLCTLKATETAIDATEKALIFPFFCVSLIAFCNLWGKTIYRERIHWPANCLAFSGILISCL